MTELIESGQIVDFILVMMALELLLIVGLALRSRYRLPTAGLLLNLGAGAGLLLALKALLAGSGWLVIGFCLSLALFAHLGDLVVRLRS